MPFNLLLFTRPYTLILILNLLNLKSFVMRKFAWTDLKHDVPSSIVVFLVAVPLCLGIALASGAPFFSGLIAGIVGGIVIGSLSGSHLSVSGPAAGLTAIVLAAIDRLGAFELFLADSSLQVGFCIPPRIARTTRAVAFHSSSPKGC